MYPEKKELRKCYDADWYVRKKEYPCAAILKRGKNLSPTSSEIYFDYIWVAHVMFRNARAMSGVPTVWVFILFFGLSSGPISTCTKGGVGKSAAECKSIPSSLRSQVSVPRLQPVWPNVLPKLAIPNFVLLRLGLIRLSVPLHPTLLVVRNACATKNNLAKKMW